jgi:hypothetical protein
MQALRTVSSHKIVLSRRHNTVIGFMLSCAQVKDCELLSGLWSANQSHDGVPIPIAARNPAHMQREKVWQDLYVDSLSSCCNLRNVALNHDTDMIAPWAASNAYQYNLAQHI